MCMQLACNVQIPAHLSGNEGQAIYIDTEGSFMAERCAEIAGGLTKYLERYCRTQPMKTTNASHTLPTTDSLLSNIFCFRVYDYVEQLSCVRSLPSFLEEHPQVRLIVMDSVAFHFRRDFNDMALRARLLTGLAQDLINLAEKYDLAVSFSYHTLRFPLFLFVEQELFVTSFYFPSFWSV